ncbi:MAG: pilus assembly protein N-terminal domain-containing protein [Pirellulaceae bacterium]|nr:pilus assembly protein N-terminal domain-containing protein [Pirellulaceae bacterium]
MLILGTNTDVVYSQTISAPQSNAMGTSSKERGLIKEVLGPDLTLEIEENHSKLIRTGRPMIRASIVDPTIVEITQFDTMNFEIIGLKTGFTDLTLWFGEPDKSTDVEILRYRVRVAASTDVEEQRQLAYKELEEMINELFPNSSIELILVANKLLVRGQARDSEEATNIMSLVRRRGFNQGNNVNNFNSAQAPQASAIGNNRNAGASNASNIINMLRVPGEQQVLLKVRIAELSRSALRELGMDFSIKKDNLSISSGLGNSGNLVAILDGGEVSLMLRALSSNAYSKILAEPNLVTLSGRTASFISGGQFAVPTAVGIGGVQAATTFFQGFGTQLQFTPTVLDKDRIRLRVAPTFSSINSGNTVNGIPGLNTRSVSTTVDMREGQWLAVAGLIEGQQQGSKVRVPGIGDVPIGGMLFGKSSVKRDETELLILVSPQLVHPLDAESIPSILPGMDVLEPDNHDFFVKNQIESINAVDFRSTVQPNVHARMRRDAHNAKMGTRYRAAQDYYICSDHGFAE